MRAIQLKTKPSRALLSTGVRDIGLNNKVGVRLENLHLNKVGVRLGNLPKWKNIRTFP